MANENRELLACAVQTIGRMHTRICNLEDAENPRVGSQRNPLEVGDEDELVAQEGMGAELERSEEEEEEEVVEEVDAEGDMDLPQYRVLRRVGTLPFSLEEAIVE
jgi:hypothetical protein